MVLSWRLSLFFLAPIARPLMSLVRGYSLSGTHSRFPVSHQLVVIETLLEKNYGVQASKSMPRLVERRTGSCKAVTVSPTLPLFTSCHIGPHPVDFFPDHSSNISFTQSRHTCPILVKPLSSVEQRRYPLINFFLYLVDFHVHTSALTASSPIF